MSEEKEENNFNNNQINNNNIPTPQPSFNTNIPSSHQTTSYSNTPNQRKSKTKIVLLIIIILFLLLFISFFSIRFYIKNRAISILEPQFNEAILPLLNENNYLIGSEGFYEDINKLRNNNEQLNQKLIQEIQQFKNNEPITFYEKVEICEKNNEIFELHQYNTEICEEIENDIYSANCGECSSPIIKEITLLDKEKIFNRLTALSSLLNLKDKILFLYENYNLKDKKDIEFIAASFMHSIQQVGRVSINWAEISSLLYFKDYKYFDDFKGDYLLLINWSENSSQKLELLKKFVNEIPDYEKEDIEKIDVFNKCLDYIDYLSTINSGFNPMIQGSIIDRFFFLNPNKNKLCKNLEEKDKEYYIYLVEKTKTQENIFLRLYNKIEIDNFVNCHLFDVQAKELDCSKNLQQQRKEQFAKIFNITYQN